MYANSVSVVNLDETSDLGTTRSAFKSAMITLADYEDFPSDPEDGSSLMTPALLKISLESTTKVKIAK